jgi:pimeloyl-ACP methyl ester carboxylesterase
MAGSPDATLSGFADVNGARLFYEIAGGGPPLTLLHGFSLDTRMWDDQCAALAQRYRVLRYDARGFGRSAVPTAERYSHAEDLRALLGYLEIAYTALIGFSLGSRQPATISASTDAG